eukprot:2320784-Lingulodinium_polyedra.AAC.2
MDQLPGQPCGRDARLASLVRVPGLAGGEDCGQLGVAATVAHQHARGRRDSQPLQRDADPGGRHGLL